MPAQVGRGLMLCRNQRPAQSTEIRVLCYAEMTDRDLIF